MGKSLDEALEAAFRAGVECDYLPRYPTETEIKKGFRRWRRHFAGLGDAEADDIGAGPAMGDQQTQDEGGTETLPRSASEVCPCSDPPHSHSKFIHASTPQNYRGVPTEDLRGL